MTPILGPPRLTLMQLTEWYGRNMPAPARTTCSVADLIDYYLTEGAAVGVAGDLAFMQAIHETGWFQFGGDVPPDHNNFAGLAATGGVPGAAFPTPQIGVRAQVQHLNRYAGGPPVPASAVVDPRYSLVTLGVAPNWEQLDGRWAVPGVGYGEAIVAMWRDALTSETGGTSMVTISPLAAAYIPGYSGHTEGPNGTIVRIVEHATVSPCVRGGARSVAGYFQSAGAGGLAHYIVDPGEIIACADENVATWGAPPNQGEIHIEFCDPQAGDPARWSDADHVAMLVLGAQLTADICHRRGVTPVRLSVAQVAGGVRGVCGHAEVSAAFHQTDHSDPDVAGPFPWDHFMAMVTGSAQPPPGQEDDMDPHKYPGAWVRKQYREIMLRNVDPAGYGTFVPFLQQGGDPEKVIQALTDSSEGQNAIARVRATVGL